MASLKSVLETFLRFLPLRTATGLTVIGKPDKNSPVMVTVNFDLTVRRLKRALKGIDCYLLVAPSEGINVWCAAAGGKFTAHSVISVLKTSDIAHRVDHRNLILPQLAGPGIDHREVFSASGWNAVFGPVAMENIPAFLESARVKTSDMAKVRFPLRDRLEMASTWAFSISVFAALILLFIRPALIPPVTAAVWLATILVYAAYFLLPLRDQIQKSLLFGLVAVPIPLLYQLAAGGLSSSAWIGWSVFLGLFAFVTAVELPDMAPMHNTASAWFWERGWYNLFVKLGWLAPQDLTYSIDLDPDKCVACGFCVSVCPVGLYRQESDTAKATQVEGDTCLRCGACILQCEGGALSKL